MPRSYVSHGLAFAAGIAIALLWQTLSAPRNWEDCILTHLRPEANERVASLLAEACDGKFPWEE